MIFAFSLCFLLTAQYSFPSTTLYLNNLSLRKVITIQEDQSSQESCLTFGIWSKYNPLNIKAFKDQKGMFESPCFQLINVMEFSTYSLTFIYYVCLDYSSKSIVKTIQFVNDQDELIKFEKFLDIFEYENIWYQFQLISWPIQKRLELVIIQSDIPIFKEILMNIKPFKEQQLLFTFGESLQVKESKIDQINQGQIFSLFPGSIVVYNPFIDLIPLSFDFEQKIIEGYYSLDQCNCLNNQQVNLEDIDLNILQDKIYISENSNCDYYSLGGWLRVSDVIQITEKFSYQFMKATAHIGKQKLLNENLATFDLFYQISPIQTKIVITTYNYNFPIVTKDILDGLQKIETEFNIQRDIITSWHYLFLELIDNELNIKLTFYDQQSHNYLHEAQVNVRQFHNYQFKLRYGNIQQDQQNYLNFEVRNLYFINCQYDLNIEKCHNSCLDCDGPGKMHCLSCSSEQQRMYLAQFKQCICSLSTLDYENKCVNYEDSNLKLKVNNQENIEQKCKAGYFEFEGGCERCPSRVKNDLITCFECYSNVRNWRLQFICQNDLYIPLLLNTSTTLITAPSSQFYHDGSDLIACEFCFLNNKYTEVQNQDSIYEIFLYKSTVFTSLCFKKNQANEVNSCTHCNIDYCVKCGIALERIICLLCDENTILVNGECKFNIPRYIYQFCEPPYYKSYFTECEICNIDKCLFCFEYFYEYQNLNTLQILENQIYEIDQDKIKIGCVLCQDGYIFNFDLSLCLKQIPRIENCLTSYVKQLQEICILSTLNNFQVSRVINDCDSFIINCYKCALDKNQIVICVECKVGFMLQDSQCYMREEFGSNYPAVLRDLLVKSFLLTYTGYFSENNSSVQQPNECGQYCQKCRLHDQQYVCDKCILEYFEETIRIQYGNYCPLCPQFCQACTSRSQDQIQTINPLFLNPQQNPNITMYQQQCLLPIMDPFIFYDPYYQTTKYCFDGICDNEFVLETYVRSCFFNRFPKTLSYFNINKEYYNHVGINALTFNIFFQIFGNFCYITPKFVNNATLKEEVFALNTARVNIISVIPFFFYFGNPIMLTDYDSVSFINSGFIFRADLQNNILLFNSYHHIDLTLINCTIMNSSIVNISSLFEAEQFGSINIQNFSIINTIIKNSSLFNLQLLKFKGQMNIVSLFIQNCTFIDSQILQFSTNLQNINIFNLTLDSSTFQNASLFTLSINFVEETILLLRNLLLQRNQFNNSYFFFCQQIIKIEITNVIFNFNIIDNSIIFGFSYGLSAHYIQIKDNIFIDSSFLQTIEVTNDKYTQCFISELIVDKNVLQNVNLFYIFSNSNSNKLLISISQVQILQNNKSITTDQSSSIFNINSKTLDIIESIINNNQEIRIFNLYDIEDIKLKNLVFENRVVEQKVSFSKNCFQRINLQNQLILIFGFDKIQIEQCKIIKQSSVDESLIEIVSSKFKPQLGSIIFRNIEFYGNLLQQLNQVQSFSLLSILSENQIDLVMKDLKYQNNFMHIYSESTLKQSATLLYINSAPSNIYINNLNCIQNSLTNSSNSFIRIATKQLALNNMLIKNHNILPYNIWKDYYPIIIVNKQDQEEINLFIMQIYHIKTIGGAAQIEASKFECLNCSFQELLTAKSSVFDIVTLNEGTVVFSNLSVNSTKYTLIEQTEGSGCISLNSQNSLLNFSIQSARFSNVINRMSTSIFSIIPSLLQNKMIIQDVYILNCISLKNQIIQIQFINQIVAFNSIQFINIKITQDQQAWTSYFQNIGQITLSEILEITGNENALISLENCDFQIRDFIVEGMLIAPVLKLINVQKLMIFNCNLDKIVSITTLDLIQISQLVYTKSLIYIKSLNIRSASIFTLSTFPTVQPAKFYPEYYIVGCLSMNNSYIIEQPEDYLYNNIISLQQSNYQRNSVIYIMSQSNLSIILLEKIKIEQNNFQTTLNGIIYFDVSVFQKIIISNYDCNSNLIKEYGCLHFLGNNSVTSKIQIKILISFIIKEVKALLLQLLMYLLIQQIAKLPLILQLHKVGLYIQEQLQKVLEQQRH